MNFPDECVATGATCLYGPHGRYGETQCKYCGAKRDKPVALEHCAFCGCEVETPCDVPPPDTCETALHAADRSRTQRAPTR